MRLLFFSPLLFLSHALLGMDAPMEDHASSIQKVKENHYQMKISEDLFFHMERLEHGKNSDFWFKLAKEERKLVEQWWNCESSSELCKNLLVGYSGFAGALNLFYYPNVELWLLYASTESMRSDEYEKSAKNIEMYCTVSTSANFPCTTHMGISSSAQFLKNNGYKRKHHNFSAELHSFGTIVMRMLHRDKIFMITTPMKVMRDIFIKTLGKENIYIAFDANWPDDIKYFQAQIDSSPGMDADKKIRMENTIKLYESYLKDSGPDPIATIGIGYSSFRLKDLSGNSILDLNKEQMKQYGWYFERDTTFSQINAMVLIPLEKLAQLLKSVPTFAQ